VRHYVRFYVSTSLVWDSFRAAGNALMVLALGPAVVAAMARFKARFTLKIEPPDGIPSVPPPAGAAEV
jgi:hypothetical protein